MFQKIIEFSINNKLLIIVGTIALLLGGIYAVQDIAIDATPDITNNQVQVVTVSPTLAPQEVEELVTFPLETQLSNIPGTIEVRSISRFGLSIITIVFEDNVPTLEARQLVKEQIDVAKKNISEGLGDPELMPITTGLGEIYQYVLRVKPGYESKYNVQNIRTIQDWIVKRQLNGIKGIIEISSYGGFIKEYEVSIRPIALESYNLTLEDVYEALTKNNENSGSGYIEQTHNLFYIRTEGRLKNFEDIENIVISVKNNVPIKIFDIADVKLGSAQRFGAMTMDGKGEVVGGITLMLKGEDSYKTVLNVKERIEQIQKNLPEGLEIYNYLDRADLIDKTISTVTSNLIEGGVIVIFVLIILLGNIRAGLIVASVIPLSLLFALALMDMLNISANLLSLGAMDFGIVVDGPIIIIEGVLHTLYTSYVGKKMTQQDMDKVTINTAGTIYKSAAFGILIIILVFTPIITLTGIEGKMFRPMALAVSFAIFGAFLLSLTYVPVMTTLFLKKEIIEKKTFADKIMDKVKSLYLPILTKVLRRPYAVVGGVVLTFFISILIFMRMGSEFVPNLQEGDLAMQMSIQPGSSLEESISTTTKAEKILIDNFPEVIHVVSKIGTAEIPTDPMGIEDADIMIILKDKKEWTSGKTQEELIDKMKDKLSSILGASFEFSQPIQLRFNELMTGAKSDVVVKIFGEDTEKLKDLADDAAEIISKITGAADIKVEQTEGLKQMKITYDRLKMAQYGLNIESLNQIIRSTIAGQPAGVILEGEKRFDLVIRLNEKFKKEFNLDLLYVRTPSNIEIPISEVATVTFESGPMMISREETRRKVNIGVNVRGVDIESLVETIQKELEQKIKLPVGYSIQYGGSFENLKAAKSRLSVAIPIALFTIIFLLYMAFKSVKDALLIFTAVPMASIGGILALWLRGLPFSISAGVGFIALFGVAVLNGIVLVSELNYLKQSGKYTSLKDVIIEGCLTRIRPVLMTAMVATLGFLPMATSTSNGAEVQHPLATVVIGGLIVATILTLFIVPLLYYMIENKEFKKMISKKNLVVIIFFIGSITSFTQAQTTVTLSEMLGRVSKDNLELKSDNLGIQKEKVESKYAYTMKNTAISLGYGQYSNTVMDYQLELSQDLGNIFSYKKTKDLSDSRVSWLQSKSILLKHTIEFQVEQLYNQWLYALEKRKLFAEIDEQYKKGLKRAEIRYEKGETDYMEKQFFKVELEQFLQQKLQNEKNYLEIKNQLFILCNINLEEDLVPEESFSKTNILFESDSLNSLYIQEYEKVKEINTKTLQLNKSERLPEISVGGVMQSMDHTYNYYAITAGVSIPLFNKNYKKSKEQITIDNQIIDNQKERMLKELNVRVKQLKEIEGIYSNELNFFGNNHKEEIEKMRQVAYTKYQYGEIDYLQYSNMLKSSVDAQLNYLDLINSYNETTIELKYLTKPNKIVTNE